MMITIKTPQTDPDHYTIGQHFSAYDGHIYYCDSYDPRIGFWMIRADAPPGHLEDQYGEWRRNVSERAIGRTFHRIYRDEEPRLSGSIYGRVDVALLIVPV